MATFLIGEQESRFFFFSLSLSPCFSPPAVIGYFKIAFPRSWQAREERNEQAAFLIAEAERDRALISQFALIGSRGHFSASYRVSQAGETSAS